jgi:hypothetical protein
MEAKETARLLEELCVKLGFCLPPNDSERLIESPPTTVDSFTDEVLRSEGMDPVTTATDLRKQVRAVVARHMGEPQWPRDRGRRPRRQHPCTVGMRRSGRPAHDGEPAITCTRGADDSGPRVHVIAPGQRSQPRPVMDSIAVIC